MEIAIRRLDADDWPVWRALRLAALADAPEAFGSTVSDWQGDLDTEARWRNRLDRVDFNVVAEADGVAVGMASGVVDDDVKGFADLELISMWVAPEGRGAGVVDALVDAVADWGASKGRPRLALAVKADNARAISAYARCGFVDAGVNQNDPTERWMIRTR